MHRKSGAEGLLLRIDLNFPLDAVHSLGDVVSQWRQCLPPAESGAGGVEGQLDPGFCCEAQNLVGLKHAEDRSAVGKGSLDGLVGVLWLERHPVDLLDRI